MYFIILFGKTIWNKLLWWGGINNSNLWPALIVSSNVMPIQASYTQHAPGYFHFYSHLSSVVSVLVFPGTTPNSAKSVTSHLEVSIIISRSAFVSSMFWLWAIHTGKIWQSEGSSLPLSQLEVFLVEVICRLVQAVQGCIAKTFYQYEQLSNYSELKLHVFPYTYIKQALMQLRYEMRLFTIAQIQGDETSMQAVLV